MGKLVMGISAAITAFVLALTAGSVYAYRRMNEANVAPSPQPTAQVSTTLQMVAAPAPTDVPNVSPQDAASIAAKFINRTDVYSVELADWQGAQSYKVTFSSGDLVYVGLTGQVLASQLPPPPTVLTTTTSGGGGHQNGGGGSGASSGDGGGEAEHEGDGG